MIPVVIFALLSPESSLIMMLLMLSCTLRYGWIWISRFIHSFFFFFNTQSLSQSLNWKDWNMIPLPPPQEFNLLLTKISCITRRKKRRMLRVSS